MPSLYMLIGIPLSGKSTWITRTGIGEDKVVLSTDNIIEALAAAVGKTYNDLWQSNYKLAETALERARSNACIANKDIIWDQTNLTVKSRAGKLITIPKHYKKIAVVFPVPEMHEIVERNESRTLQGKHIPMEVINNMIKIFQYPTMDEGFDEILEHFKW